MLGDAGAAEPSVHRHLLCIQTPSVPVTLGKIQCSAPSTPKGRDGKAALFPGKTSITRLKRLNLVGIWASTCTVSP